MTAGLVAERVGGPGRFTFVHALIRHTLYEELGATRRARMHRRIAEALEVLHGADQDGRRLSELRITGSPPPRPPMPTRPSRTHSAPVRRRRAALPTRKPSVSSTPPCSCSTVSATPTSAAGRRSWRWAGRSGGPLIPRSAPRWSRRPTTLVVAPTLRCSRWPRWIARGSDGTPRRARRTARSFACSKRPPTRLTEEDHALRSQVLSRARHRAVLDTRARTPRAVGG